MKPNEPYETEQDKYSRKMLHYKERGRIGRKQTKGLTSIPPKDEKLHPNIIPLDPIEQNRLADECFEYVTKNQPESINDFPLSKGMSPYRFKRIAKNNPYFAEVLELCMYTIGRRIEEEWRHFKCDKSFARDYLYIYDKDYREVRQEMNSDIANVLTQHQPVIPIYETPADVRRRESGNGESISIEVQSTPVSDKSDNGAGK